MVDPILTQAISLRNEVCLSVTVEPKRLFFYYIIYGDKFW